jgi:hypothetical protein
MIHFIMVAASVILWIAAILLSGAVGMCIEEGNKKSADIGYGLMATFAICAFILQVMA